VSRLRARMRAELRRVPPQWRVHGVVLEVVAGVGRVASAVRSQGLGALTLELNDDVLQDVGLPGVM